MKTFNCYVTFTCANTGELKRIKREYKAKDKEQALAGLIEYCEINKTILEVLKIAVIDQ